VGSSPQRRENYLDLQRGREEHPVALIYDVKTRWNSTLNMLERALRTKAYTREWIREYPLYEALWSTPAEWKMVEYILQVLEPIRFCTLWMSKTRGPTIHRVFEVYDAIFDHLDDQISILSKKRMRWKVEIKEALEKARRKASKYYGKTENPRGLLMALGACLNPYTKLESFRMWDATEADGTPGAESYTEKYRQLFIQYYNEHYRPPLETGAIGDVTTSTTQARSTGFGRRSKLSTVRYSRPVERNECLEYIDSPNEVDYQADLKKNSDDPLYEANILQYWKNNVGRFPNLSRMARDILAVQGGSVGVERIFSMGRDVIPYRRNRLGCKSIQATMIVKSYLREQLKKDIDGSDPDAEKIQLQSELALSDYQSAIPLEKEGYISDDNEVDKRDTSWDFVEQDGVKAFRRDRVVTLPARQEHITVARKGRGHSELANGGYTHIGSGDERYLAADEEGAEDEEQYEYIGSDTDEDEELGEGHERGGLESDDGEETDLDESQGNDASVQIGGERQRSRKRAASNLAVERQKAWKRK
jgi:hypothetical protein